MGTLLTTSKMPPALAARVEASVRGTKANAPRSPKLRIRAVARVLVVVAIASVTTTVVSSWRSARREREAARVALVEAARAARQSVTNDDLEAVARVEGLLVRLATESVALPSVTPAPNDFTALLARPSVYVRGPLTSFLNAKGVADAAAESSKDSLLGCLFDPPASRAERVVFAKVVETYPGSTRLEELTAHVRRVGDARTGLPFLTPAWAHAAAGAEDVNELKTLHARLQKAPLARAREALRAELLIVAMDDMASGTGPTELDGTRAHEVRFVIADIRSSSVLVRLSKRMDPSWISIPRRPTHANKLASCVLALDLREAASR